MPTKIQRHEQALALARAYNIKGKLPLQLDETVVPVHIVGELDPSEWTPSRAPAGSDEGIIHISGSSAGVGRRNFGVVEIVGGAGRPMVVDWVDIGASGGGAGKWVYGIGIEDSPLAVDVDVPRGGLRTNLANFSRPTAIEAFGTCFHAAGIPGEFMGAFESDAAMNGGNGGRINLGIVLGVVPSGPADWRTANGAVLTRGTAEFWLRRPEDNASDFEVSFHVTLLPPLTT